MEDLEEQSDALLAEAGALSKGIYRERDLISQNRRVLPLREKYHRQPPELEKLDVQRFLLSLTACQRRTVEAVVHAKSRRKAAEVMGVSVQTVGCVLRRALSKWEAYRKNPASFITTDDAHWAYKAEQITKHRLIYRHTTHPLKSKWRTPRVEPDSLAVPIANSKRKSGRRHKCRF